MMQSLTACCREYDQNPTCAFSVRAGCISDQLFFVADVDFFAQLDRDGDGRVTVDDLKHYIAKINLSPDYAVEFVNRARGGRWWSSSITCALHSTHERVCR